MIGVRERSSGIPAGLVCLATLLSLGGCADKGPKTAPVQGTVTYNGKPVPHGTIMFQPADGPAAVAQIREGAYQLKTFTDGDGAVPGRHKVTVISLADQSGRLPEQRNPLPPAVVPLKFSFPDQSGLTADVEDKPNVINFDLK
jgi:hypothetical protein